MKYKLSDEAQAILGDDPEKNVRGHAYGTGLSKRAHYEAQEAGRFDREFQEGMLNAKVRKYL